MDLKSSLENVRDKIAELEAVVRGELENKHLADVLKSASGKLHDAAGHPDLEKIETKMREHDEEPPFPGADAGAEQTG